MCHGIKRSVSVFSINLRNFPVQLYSESYNGVLVASNLPTKARLTFSGNERLCIHKIN